MTDFDKKTIMAIFPYIKFVFDKNTNQHIVYKNHHLAPQIKEILYYCNLDFPNIPKLLSINKLKFSMLEYQIMDRNIVKLDIKNFLCQMLKTLDYLHSKGFIHSDIKFINILQKDNIYYLIDFGISEFYSFNHRKMEYKSSFGYVLDNLNKQNNNNKNVDIFSLAITVINILTQHPIYNDQISESSTDIILKLDILKNEIIKYMGDNGFELLKSMLGLKNNSNISNIDDIVSPSEALNSDYFNIEYIPIQQNWDITIDTKFNENININIYFDCIIKLLKLSIRLNYHYSTFLFTISIFRLITQNDEIIKNTNLYLIGISVFIITSIINQTEYLSLDDAKYLINGSFNTKEIKNCIINIIENYYNQIKIIPYDYFLIPHDEYNICIFIYLFSFRIDQFKDITLKELTLKTQTYNTNIHTIFKYETKYSILQNVEFFLNLNL